MISYVFWMGDLNFRLKEEFDKTPEEIERLVVKKEMKALFEHDQLRYVMRKGEAFSELTEQDPTFPPTFKFTVGTPCYDYKRRPAWCDRILYKVNSNNYENVTLKVDQLSYKSHPNYVLSDHKPVTAEFFIKIPMPYLPPPRVQRDSKPSVDQVFSDYAESVIEFDKVISWDVEGENKAYYKLTKDIKESDEDWIGLFKEDFCALDDYVTYEYVSKCATPTDESSSSSRSHETKKYEVTFPDLPNKFKGNYCLVYFSQTEDKVTSVLGVSNIFPIVKADSD